MSEYIYDDEELNPQNKLELGFSLEYMRAKVPPEQMIEEIGGTRFSLASDNDSVNQFGPGISNFFLIQERFIFIFFWLSICIALPEILIYSGQWAPWSELDDYDQFPASWSLGNMGYSKALCTGGFIDTGSVSLEIKCEATTTI